jgi:purine catabolism regulator
VGYRAVVRVRELLEMDLLRDAGVEVVGGRERLDDPVRWVHNNEIADIAQYLSGGEALLTAATGVRDSEPDRRRYVRELREAGAVCVIVELGRHYRTIPPEMVDEADKGGPVLATLDREVPFVAVTQQAHTLIVSSAHVTLQGAIEIDDALNRLILDGAPLMAMLDLLAERLDNPVVLEDGARRVVAHGGASRSVTPLLHGWQAHSRQGHRLDRAASVQVATEPHRCAWSAIAVHGEDWGRLHVIEVDGPLDDLARLTLSRAAPSIGLYLMAERDAALSDAAELSLIGGLAQAERFNGREFLARASGLGVDLDGDLVMLVFEPGAGRANGTADEVVALGVSEARRALREGQWPAVVGALGSSVAVVATADPPGSLAAATESLASGVSAGPLGALEVGVSRRCRAAQLPQAYTEANAAQRLGPLSGAGRVHFYDALVLYRLLSPLAAGPALANFVEGELGPLLANESQQRAELLHTLDAYLHANGNKIATAQTLHLQRRSVYYRLDRIEELLGRSLDDPEQRVRLYLALRAHEILEAKVGGDDRAS